MAADYYAVLGVAKDATQEEIKKKYRAIARKFHPDKNPGDAAAEAIFKDAAEAYRVLGDLDLRAQYDRNGRASSFAPSADSADGVFDEIFGGVRAKPRPGTRAESRGRPGERGADLRYSLELAFEEAALGAEKRIVVPQTERCERCAGTGAMPGSAPVLCQDCAGSGTIKQQLGFFDNVTRCPRCQGAGKLIPHDCRACRGSGKMKVDRVIAVRVPPGVDSATRLKLSGEGEVGRNGGAPGDLYVVIKVQPHPLFERDGEDVVTEVPISMILAALGGEADVATVDGPIRMRVPPGSQSGRMFRLKGRGVASADGRRRGDQRVRILVDVPDQVTDEQRSLLERLSLLEEREGKPPRAAAYEQLVNRLFSDKTPKR